MKLIDFDFDHLLLFDWRENEYDMYNTNSDFVNTMISMEKQGEMFTALHDGRILMIGGVIPVTKKTGYAFSAFSKHAENHKIMCGKTIKRMMHCMMEDMGLHRLTTYNLVVNGHHHKWCEWLGFKSEGVVEKYDDEGRDYIQYGLVK